MWETVGCAKMQVMKRTIFALLVARPGPLKDGLRALLTAIPQIDTVGQVRDLSAAPVVAAEFQPRLVIVDGGWPRLDLAALLREIQAVAPGTRSIVLAQDVPQQAAAQAAGADAVLLIGSFADELAYTVEQLV